jgi:hypothetical protein
MYGECYETVYTLNDEQFVDFKCKRFRNTRHNNISNTIIKLFLKHPALPVKVTLNRNYSR